MPFDSTYNQYIRKDNEDCITIYSLLYKYFLAIEKSIAPKINIISIYFDDIMKIMGGYVMKYNEINSPYNPPEDIYSYKVSHFPYIDYVDIKKGLDPNDKIYNKSKNISFKRRLFSQFSHLNNRKRKKVGITYGNRKLIIQLLRSGFGIDFLYKEDINIDHFNKQITYINLLIEEVLAEINIPISPEPIINLIINHINSFLDDNYDSGDLESDIIIAGSMSERVNIFYGTISRIKHIPFISVSHGEGDQIMMDEPRFGYGERSIPTILFGYGKGGADINSNNSKYLNSLYLPPLYVSSNSDIINNIYKNESINIVNDLDSMIWMYVPDSLLYHQRRGPFGGNIPDQLYIDWGRTICNSFKSLIIKRHPKGHKLFRNKSNQDILLSMNISKDNNVRIISDNFSYSYNQCDGYIFDHISTAFMIASATNKPIIYFNIGKRNLTIEAERIVKKRCLWIDIDPNNSSEIKERVRGIQGMSFSNDLTEKYSLDVEDLNMLRNQKLYNLIASKV